MEWNNILTELNYYLANLYLNDDNNTSKKRLASQAKLNPIMIAWEPSPINTWFNILKKAADSDKVARLLESILDEKEGNSDDAFLKGALKNINDKRDTSMAKITMGSWKGSDSTDFATNEKIMGRRSTLLPIGFLEKGVDAAKAVVRLIVGERIGTGFIIGNGWLVTNNHVIPSPAEAGAAVAEFGFQFEKGQKINQMKTESLKAEQKMGLDQRLFFTSEAGDWTIVKLNRPEDVAHYGHLNLSASKAAEGDFVNIIQHPLGGPKQIGIYNNLVTYAGDDVLQYLTDTLPGSSGSPVFNKDWEVVALHHSGGWLVNSKTGQTVNRNEGIAIQKVSNFINANKLLD